MQREEQCIGRRVMGMKVCGKREYLGEDGRMVKDDMREKGVSGEEMYD